jgi:hypothetical protein
MDDSLNELLAVDHLLMTVIQAAVSLGAAPRAGSVRCQRSLEKTLKHLKKMRVALEARSNELEAALQERLLRQG